MKKYVYYDPASRVKWCDEQVTARGFLTPTPLLLPAALKEASIT